MINSSDPLNIVLQVIAGAGRNLLEIAAVIDYIDGWLTYDEGAALFSAAAFGQSNGVIVEIGSFKGRSTVWLARGSKAAKREKVYAIDPHTGSPEHQRGGAQAAKMPDSGTTQFIFTKNLRFFDALDWVEPMTMTSAQANKDWKLPIRLLFIDGAHDYESVLFDYQSWEPHVVPGGIIAFHDVYQQGNGPDKVIDDFVKRDPRFRELGLINGLYLTQKV